MPKGVIRYFNEGRGYGFIESNEQTQGNGENVYVHHSEIVADGYKTLKEGQQVSFELREGEHGLEATNVTKLS